MLTPRNWYKLQDSRSSNIIFSKLSFQCTYRLTIWHWYNVPGLCSVREALYVSIYYYKKLTLHVHLNNYKPVSRIERRLGPPNKQFWNIKHSLQLTADRWGQVRFDYSVSYVQQMVVVFRLGPKFGSNFYISISATILFCTDSDYKSSLLKRLGISQVN